MTTRVSPISRRTIARSFERVLDRAAVLVLLGLGVSTAGATLLVGL
jgi:hypothetical protein